MNPSNGKFMKSQKMGIKKINGFMKAMVEKISDANGEKYTYHSNRKTLITTLLGNNIERSDIGQLSGHRNVQSRALIRRAVKRAGPSKKV